LSEPEFRGLEDPESLRQLVRRLKEGIYVTTERGRILDANPAFLEILGVASLADLRQYSAADLLVDPEERERQVRLLREYGSLRDYELKIRRPDGQVRTVIDAAYAVKAPNGETLYYGILVDITERKRLEEQLVEQSIRDPLTGCFNRRYLGEFESHMLRQHRDWGCIVLDVDRFKEYNDRFGHQIGDQVLRRVSRFLMRQTRADEGVVRFGGDEFVVLLAGADAASTERPADRLKQLGAREVPVSFSLGWAAREGGESLERTIHRADKALLAVRSQERSRTEERRSR